MVVAAAYVVGVVISVVAVVVEFVFALRPPKDRYKINIPNYLQLVVVVVVCLIDFFTSDHQNCTVLLGQTCHRVDKS